jgi:glycosyltransferase involved in cell wall biosynthesis
MKTFRVLQVVTIMNRGGLETMLMNYYRNIDHEKVQFDFLVHRNEKGHYDDEIINLGGRIYRMPQIRPGNYMKYIKLLKDFFEEHKEYSVVHSHINENSSFVLRAAKKANIPCRIVHSHISNLGFDFKLPFRYYARFLMQDHPNELFACSKNAASWLYGKNKCKTDKVKILNNAINVDEFSYNEITRRKMKKRLGLKEEELVIGHVGRFSKQKNHSFLIDIFKEINNRNPESILLLVGEGDLLPKIKAKVKQLGLSNKVIFLGVRGDIADLMQAMDIFLFPSLFEGLPVVLIEAQAAGLQCFVSSKITQESNITGKIKFISLKENVETWAEKLLSVSVSRNENVDQLFTKGFDSKSTAKWLSDFYLQYS